MLDGSLIDGRYRLGSLLGEGGMAFVYAAEDLLLQRPVALKLAKGSSELQAERLFREATAAARTNHPAVVMVLAYGTDLDLGVDYLVMERLSGETLASRARRVPRLPVELVLRLFFEVGDALAAAHEAGILHRDLKPSNIFLARRGLQSDDIRLLDFGIAKHLDLHTITRPDQLLGTVRYMAPEQLMYPGHADARTDVYALGVSLYECLAGTHPFEANSASHTVARILAGIPHTPAALRPDLPRSFATILETCVAVDPAVRPANGRALCAALHAARDALREDAPA